jgi:membrane protein YqaA with SNARE-associated domain
MRTAAVHETPRPSSALLRAGTGMAAVILIAGAAMVLLADEGRRRDMELILQSPIGLIGLFVFSALSSATLLLPVPGIALTVIAAPLAPPLLVGVIAGLGQTIGELTGYFAGASGGTLVGQRLTASWMARWMRRRGMLALFFLALVPNPVFDVAGMIAGMARMPLAQYLLAAGAGKVMRNTLLAWTLVSAGALLVP